MIADPFIFDPSGTLPDVAKSIVLPGQGGSASALAGIRSGKDYADAIYNATRQPLNYRQDDKDDLDRAPVETPLQKELKATVTERQTVARKLRSALGGPGRDYSTPPVSSTEPPLPGTESIPDTLPSEDGNILLPAAPPPIPEGESSPLDNEPSLFPKVGAALPWNPARVFRAFV